MSGFAHWGHWAPHVRWKEDTNEDDAFAVVRFTDGSLLTLHMSNLNASPRPGWLEIHGTKGCYIMSGTDYEIRTYDPEKKEIQVEKGENPPGEQWRYYQNIADHLTGQAELIISTEWARRPIHILDLACQSARENRTLLARYP